jgi:hypothetical protein
MNQGVSLAIASTSNPGVFKHGARAHGISDFSPDLCSVVVPSLPCLRVARRASARPRHPRDVTVQAFAKPEAQRFRLLVRVPLKAIMDIEFPRKERDFVDMERVDQSLRDAAMIWLARKIELYEENSLVPIRRFSRRAWRSNRIGRSSRTNRRSRT